MTTHLALEQPSAWVQRFAGLIPAGEVLDLACGGGRHARLLAAAGHRVLGVDRNPEALASLAAAGIAVQQLDLEQDDAQAAWPFAAQRFAGIVVTNYLHRPLFPRILSSLAVDGVFICETFALGNAQFGKPSNPDFLLAPGELLEIVRQNAPALAPHSLRVIAFEDGYTALPKPAMVQRICVRKGVGTLATEGVRLL